MASATSLSFTGSWADILKVDFLRRYNFTCENFAQESVRDNTFCLILGENVYSYGLNNCVQEGVIHQTDVKI